MDDSSASDSLTDECWICRDTSSTPDNPIISRVCRCIGTIGSVHQNCIDRWVFQNERMECPSCGATYSIVYICSQVLTYPESVFSEVKLVVTGLFIPIMAKLIILILGVLLSFVLLPLIIGFIYYGERSWLQRSSTVTWVQFLEVYTYGVTNIFLIRLAIFGFNYWICHPRRHQRRQRQEDPLMDRRVYVQGPVVEGNDNNPHPQDDGLETSDEDSENSDSEHEHRDDDAFCDFSKTGFAASAHDWIDSMKKQFGIDDRFFRSLARDLCVACPLALIFRTPQGLAVTFTIFVATWVLWQIWIPKREIQNPRRRYEEVIERLGDLTSTEVMFLYMTYVLETLLFSFILPIIAGVVVHYGTAPFLVKTPDSLSSFMTALNIYKIVGYWVIGMLCSLVLMATMYNVILPLFAPGVELFYIRSVDFRSLDTHTLRLNLMFTRVFDVGPSQLVLDFFGILIFEMGALLFFIAMPCWVTFGIREALFSDLSSGRLSIPLSFGLPSRSDLSLRSKFADVQQLLKTSQTLHSHDFSTHSDLEKRSKLHAETVVLTHLAKAIASDPQAVLKAMRSLSLDDTKPFYRSTALALTVAALYNDTTILSRLLHLEHQNWSVVDTSWVLMRVLASSGYVCPMCFLSVGNQLSFFETSSSDPLISPSNRRSVERMKPENRDGALMDLPQKKGNATGDFLSSRDLFTVLGPVILKWNAQWAIPIHGTFANNQTNGVIHSLFDVCNIVHEPQRHIPTSGSQPEAARWSPEQVFNWNDSSLVCLVLVLTTCLCRIPGFGSTSRLILNFFLYKGNCIFFLQTIGLISMTLIFFMCLIQFPIKKMQLRYLRPFAFFFGRAMGLEAFLFDAERLKLVDQYLGNINREHLEVPIVPPEAILLRRELVLPRQNIPPYFKLRLFVFAMSFLLIGTLLFWLPFIIIFIFMLCVPLPTVTMLLGTGCIFFFLFDPSEFLECVMLAHGLILVLLGFILFSFYWTLSKLSLKKLAQETFFYICKVKRHVSAYDLERESFSGEDRMRQKMLFIVEKTSRTEQRPILIPVPDDDNEDGNVPA
ncbi:unnamed protein product [Phytomonas sp. Hart1]|nr:unnamed protein product [Phytomonas sp. Hart1]|eukprot:CCW67346.1 unnamed protein product [Phytomonas sp. isolate Hart1]